MRFATHVAVWLVLVVVLAAVACQRSASPDRPLAGGTVDQADARLPALRPASDTSPRTRRFWFDYHATVTGLTPGSRARVWLPVAASNDEQRVEIVSQQLPGEGQFQRDAEYGNRILYVESQAGDEGTLELKLRYAVERREVRTPLSGRPVGAPPRLVSSLSARERELYLAPHVRVPTSGKPLELLRGKKLSADRLQLTRQLYDLVEEHMTYKKVGTGWGQGDAVWACDSRYGNCTDFHSLFIALARSQGLPARFEIGFPLPAERGAGEVPGYHCWASVWVEPEGWVPVDISEADKNPALKDYYFGNLTEDRVTFSIGRDLKLSPPQEGPPLNFFVYPYVEVGGEPWPAEKIQTQFRYEDQAQ